MTLFSLISFDYTSVVTIVKWLENITSFVKIKENSYSKKKKIPLSRILNLFFCNYPHNVGRVSLAMPYACFYFLLFIKAVLKRDFPPLSPIKNVWMSYGVILDESDRHFQELLLKVGGIECCFSFFYKCISVRVEKTNDRQRSYRQ